MNCKPGDLAVVVRVNDPSFTWSLGRIVRCVEFVGIHRGQLTIAHDAWATERFIGPDGLGYGFVSDSSLRPLRDPGDDVHDAHDILVRTLSEVTG